MPYDIHHRLKQAIQLAPGQCSLRTLNDELEWHAHHNKHNDNYHVLIQDSVSFARLLILGNYFYNNLCVFCVLDYLDIY